MVHITIEYMIMIPILIAQIFIIPFAATSFMNVWVDSRRTLQLQDISGNLGSSIQQIYYAINHASISSGSLTSKLDIPLQIDDGYSTYNYTITLKNATNPNSDVVVMNLTLNIEGAAGYACTLITLGQNAVWQNNLTYNRFSISLVNATKIQGSVLLSFEGGT
jgi:hypothetical protein